MVYLYDACDQISDFCHEQCINIYLKYPKLCAREYRRAIKDGQYRKTGKIGYTKRRKTKQRHHTIWVELHYTQINTNNLNMTRTLPQTTGCKDEPNIAFMRKSQRTSQHGTQNIKTHNRTAQKTKKMCNTDPARNLGWTQAILKFKLFLLLIRYTYSQSSPVKSLGDDRGKKYLRIK
jgi:hypothetical protein